MQTAFNAIQSMHTHTFKPESFVVPTAIYCLAGDLFVTQFKDLLHAEQLQEKFWTFFLLFLSLQNRNAYAHTK